MWVKQGLRVEGSRWARAAVAGLPLFARRVRQSTLNKRRLQVQFDSIDMIEGAVRRVLDTQKTSPWLDSGAAAEYLSRSEEHTSELQSLMRISYAVYCLKNKKKKTTKITKK